MSADPERIATARAALALCAIELRELVDGTYQAVHHAMTRALPTVAAVEALAREALARIT